MTLADLDAFNLLADAAQMQIQIVQPQQQQQQQQPGQTVQPAQPAQPTQPVQPAQPVQPVQPAPTAQPAQPTQPAQQTQPSPPSQPAAVTELVSVSSLIDRLPDLTLFVPQSSALQQIGQREQAEAAMGKLLWLAQSYWQQWPRGGSRRWA